MEMFYKSELEKCGHPELYEKFLDLGYKSVTQAHQRIKDNRDILVECGITNTTEQEKIVTALQSGVNKLVPIVMFVTIIGGGFLMYLFLMSAW